MIRVLYWDTISYNLYNRELFRDYVRRIITKQDVEQISELLDLLAKSDILEQIINSIEKNNRNVKKDAKIDIVTELNIITLLADDMVYKCAADNYNFLTDIFKIFTRINSSSMECTKYLKANILSHLFIPNIIKQSFINNNSILMQECFGKYNPYDDVVSTQINDQYLSSTLIMQKFQNYNFISATPEILMLIDIGCILNTNLSGDLTILRTVFRDCK